jgi:hypothetical protein
MTSPPSKSVAQLAAERIMNLTCPRWERHHVEGQDLMGQCSTCHVIYATTRIIQAALNKEREKYANIAAKAKTGKEAENLILQTEGF